MKGDDIMTTAEMIRKIESLEKRVKELEGKQTVVVHHHYPASAPYLPPQWQPEYVPYLPPQWQPEYIQSPWIITRTDDLVS